MNLFHAFILGIVEGLTEFLPISSTFHLLFAGKLLHLEQTAFSNFFDVFIQGAAMIPVVIVFGKEWFRDRALLMKVGAAFVPTAIVGFVLHKVIKEVLFTNNALMLAAFAGVGLLFIVVEWLIHTGKIKVTKSLAELTIAQAAMVGLWQATAVLPGVSRAGAVMIGLLLMGYRHDEAAKFSFMLAVPTILAAAGYDFLKMRGELGLLSTDALIPLAMGCAAAFFSSLLIVRWFIEYLKKHSLAEFGWYRIVAAGVLALVVGV